LRLLSSRFFLLLPSPGYPFLLPFPSSSARSPFHILSCRLLPLSLNNAAHRKPFSPPGVYPAASCVSVTFSYLEGSSSFPFPLTLGQSTKFPRFPPLSPLNPPFPYPATTPTTRHFLSREGTSFPCLSQWFLPPFPCPAFSLFWTLPNLFFPPSFLNNVPSTFPPFPPPRLSSLPPRQSPRLVFFFLYFHSLLLSYTFTTISGAHSSLPTWSFDNAPSLPSLFPCF